MIIRLESASGRPLYQQIVDQVKQMVAAGSLREGDRLPTVRELSAQLIVNPNTVAHAFQQLEREKVIETRRGLGSFIASTSTGLSHAERVRIVAAHIDRALVEAYHVSIGAEELRRIFEERLAEFRADIDRPDSSSEKGAAVSAGERA
jgi:GntR family transcriptional regulator